MIVATEEPDEHRLRFLLTGLSKEALTEVSDLVKRSFEFADRERCRYFTMIRGAKHYHNCLVVSRVLEERLPEIDVSGAENETKPRLSNGVFAKFICRPVIFSTLAAAAFSV